MANHNQGVPLPAFARTHVARNSFALSAAGRGGLYKGHMSLNVPAFGVAFASISLPLLSSPIPSLFPPSHTPFSRF